MTALRCRQCGKAIAIPSRGPRPTYCSDACRKAAQRARDPFQAQAMTAAHRANATAKAYGAPGRLTAEDVLAVWTAQPTCIRCGSGRGIDHRVGFADGGSNELGNLQNLCPSCNVAKSNADRAGRRRRAEDGPPVDSQATLAPDVALGPTTAGSVSRVSSYGRGLGDGDDCPQDPAHGAMYVFGQAASPEAKQWCPSSLHRGGAWYARDGLSPISRDGRALPAAGGSAEPWGSASGRVGGRERPTATAPA